MSPSIGPGQLANNPASFYQRIGERVLRASPLFFRTPKGPKGDWSTCKTADKKNKNEGVWTLEGKRLTWSSVVSPHLLRVICPHYKEGERSAIGKKGSTAASEEAA